MLLFLRIRICCMIQIEVCLLLSISCIDLQVGIRFFSQRLSGLSFCLSVCFSKRKDEIDSFALLITSMFDLLYFPSY